MNIITRLFRARSTLYDFISPIIIGALGLAAGGFGASVVTAVVSTAISIGLSYAAQALVGKPTSTVRGVRVGLRVETDPPRDAILGEAATAGQLVYWHTWGQSNGGLQLVIALASHPIDGVTEIWVNGEKVTWNPVTKQVAEYPTMYITIYDGTQTTAHPSLVTRGGGRWASTAVGRGVAYAVVEMWYKASIYKKGIPEFLFRVRGAKLYDPRTELTAYSDNPAVIAYNLLRGVSYNGLHLIGMRSPAEAIRLDDAIAAMNACDELVLLASGGYEKRYRCGMVVDCRTQNRPMIEAAVGSMAGKLVHSGGIYRIMAGVARSAVAHITDADIMADAPLTTSARLPRSQLVNAVFGSYTSPDLGHKTQALPPRTSSADEAADGGIRLPITLQLSSVFSSTQAQRIMEIERRRARRMATASAVLRARWSALEVGDWITYTSDLRGFDTKSYEIVTTKVRADQRIEVSLREMDDAVDDWTTSDELADNASTDLPPGAPSTASLSPDALTNVTIATESGSARPGLKVTWTPPDDPGFVELTLEYRRVGDTEVLERRIADPEAGSYTWLDGVQGGATYEARIKPVTAPLRDAAWSTWTQASGDSDPQIVDIAVFSETVADGSVGVDQLDAQAAFELALSTAVASVQGSVNQRFQAMQEQFERVASSIDIAYEEVDRTQTRLTTTQQVIVAEREALAQQITVAVAALQADINTRAAASVVDLIEARVTANEDGISAQAALVTSLSTTVGGHTTEIAEHAASIDGIEGRYGVSITVDGYVNAAIELGSGSGFSFFGVVADAFFVAQPGVGGGDPVQIFTIGNVDGSPAIVLGAPLLSDDAILARHISAGAIETAHLAVGVEIVAPYIRNAASTSYIDFDTGDFQFG